MDIRADYLDFDHAGVFSERDVAFAKMDSRILKHIPYRPDMSSLIEAAAKRKNHSVDRSRLCEVLADQYADIDHNASQLEAISQLRNEDSFTIVTAHQPSLALGPLYFVYKTMSAIKLARMVSAEADVHVVPVFVIGGEDHDFEEIASVHLFNQTITWDNQGQSGAVGRMQLHGLKEVYDQLTDLLGDRESAIALKEILQEWLDTQDYGRAVQRILHRLFGHLGLIVLRMDDARLKKLFVPAIKKELLEQVSQELVLSTQAALATDGFGAQAYPREINFFYHHAGGRDRIIREDDHYHVLNSDISWTRDEMIAHIEEHAEHFSPNVVMRPIYQEVVLPNIAYVGGGGELAYWTERQSQFEAFDAFFPVLIRRDSFLLLDDKSQSQMQEYDLSIGALTQDLSNLVSQFVNDQKPEDYNLDYAPQVVSDLYDKIIAQVKPLDEPLSRSIEAEKVKALKSIDGIDKRFTRSYKQKQDVVINRIKKLRGKVLPHDKLQERYESFIPSYLKYGSRFFDILLEHADPLDMRLKVLNL